jgi:hypothetical protein
MACVRRSSQHQNYCQLGLPRHVVLGGPFILPLLLHPVRIILNFKRDFFTEVTRIVDEQQYSVLTSKSDEGTTINVTIQFGWIGTVRNILTHANNCVVALSEQKQKHHRHHRRVVLVLVIFRPVFPCRDVWGPRLTAKNTVENRAKLSSSSTRFIPSSPHEQIPHVTVYLLHSM